MNIDVGDKVQARAEVLGPMLLGYRNQVGTVVRDAGGGWVAVRYADGRELLFDAGKGEVEVVARCTGHGVLERR